MLNQKISKGRINQKETNLEVVDVQEFKFCQETWLRQVLIPSKIILFIAFIIISNSYTVDVFSQTNWVKHTENPVLDYGPSGSWDEYSCLGGSVLFDGTLYHIWYAGYDGTNYRIGHATSFDGIQWTKDPLNPVLDIGSPGSWEDLFVYGPNVLLVEQTFHMWYAGNNGSLERMGHATSSDGVTWTKDPNNPALSGGPSGSWDELEVFPLGGSVLFDENNYHLWYGGLQVSNFRYAVGYATSPNGITWTKHPNNPVLERGLWNEWDAGGVVPGTVLFDDNTYHFWYNGHDGDYLYNVGYATSPDGIQWTKDTLNPVLKNGPTGSFDYEQAWNGFVLLDTVSQTYKMWYSGGEFFSSRIGYATSEITTSIKDNLQSNKTSIFELSKNFPNPFSQATTIQYSLSKPANVSIKVYDTQGRTISTLFNAKQIEGNYSMVWNGVDMNGSLMPNGVYIFQIEVDKNKKVQKMLLAR